MEPIARDVEDGRQPLCEGEKNLSKASEESLCLRYREKAMAALVRGQAR